MSVGTARGRSDVGGAGDCRFKKTDSGGVISSHSHSVEQGVGVDESLLGASIGGLGGQQVKIHLGQRGLRRNSSFIDTGVAGIGRSSGSTSGNCGQSSLVSGLSGGQSSGSSIGGGLGESDGLGGDHNRGSLIGSTEGVGGDGVAGDDGGIGEARGGSCVQCRKGVGCSHAADGGGGGQFGGSQLIVDRETEAGDGFFVAEVIGEADDDADELTEIGGDDGVGRGGGAGAGSGGPSAAIDGDLPDVGEVGNGVTISVNKQRSVGGQNLAGGDAVGTDGVNGGLASNDVVGHRGEGLEVAAEVGVADGDAEGLSQINRRDSVAEGGGTSDGEPAGAVVDLPLVAEGIDGGQAVGIAEAAEVGGQDGGRLGAGIDDEADICRSRGAGAVSDDGSRAVDVDSLAGDGFDVGSGSEKVGVGEDDAEEIACADADSRGIDGGRGGDYGPGRAIVHRLLPRVHESRRINAVGIINGAVVHRQGRSDIGADGIADAGQANGADVLGANLNREMSDGFSHAIIIDQSGNVLDVSTSIGGSQGVVAAVADIEPGDAVIEGTLPSVAHLCVQIDSVNRGVQSSASILEGAGQIRLQGGADGGRADNAGNQGDAGVELGQRGRIGSGLSEAGVVNEGDGDADVLAKIAQLQIVSDGSSANDVGPSQTVAAVLPLVRKGGEAVDIDQVGGVGGDSDADESLVDTGEVDDGDTAGTDGVGEGQAGDGFAVADVVIKTDHDAEGLAIDGTKLKGRIGQIVGESDGIGGQVGPSEAIDAVLPLIVQSDGNVDFAIVIHQASDIRREDRQKLGDQRAVLDDVIGEGVEGFAVTGTIDIGDRDAEGLGLIRGKNGVGGSGGTGNRGPGSAVIGGDLPLVAEAVGTGETIGIGETGEVGGQDGRRLGRSIDNEGDIGRRARAGAGRSDGGAGVDVTGLAGDGGDVGVGVQVGVCHRNPHQGTGGEGSEGAIEQTGGGVEDREGGVGGAADPVPRSTVVDRILPQVEIGSRVDAVGVGDAAEVGSQGSGGVVETDIADETNHAFGAGVGGADLDREVSSAFGDTEVIGVAGEEAQSAAGIGGGDAVAAAEADVDPSDTSVEGALPSVADLGIEVDGVGVVQAVQRAVEIGAGDVGGEGVADRGNAGEANNSVVVLADRTDRTRVHHSSDGIINADLTADIVADEKKVCQCVARAGCDGIPSQATIQGVLPNIVGIRRGIGQSGTIQ